MAARRRVPRLVTWTATAAVVAVVAATLAGSAPARSTGPVVVQVGARDFSFKLSRRSVPAGSTVRFVVRNRGSSPHDFVLKGQHTRRLRPGTSQTIAIRFPKKGTFSFLCSVSGHARLGMKGTFAVGKPAPAAPTPPPPVVVSGTARLTSIGQFNQPVFVTAPPDDPDRVFVVEQSGAVRVVRDGSVLPNPYLDLRDKVTFSGESGLLSIAFAPDYSQTGHLYVFYNSREGGYGDSHISEFRRGADPDTAEESSERLLLTIPKPYENHNGGMLQFGPDGDLYASVGDGDPGVLHRAGFFAQRFDVLLGGIIRIDPRTGDPYAIPAGNPFAGVTGARPEIWAKGLRNPWRFWIDPETGVTVIGDDGSTSREEVDVIPPGASGLNFGWPCFEGTLVFDPTATCEKPVVPALEIPHEGGVCAIVGGVVVSDPRLTALSGKYLFGDLCTGKITAAVISSGRVTATDDLGLQVPSLTSFGVDGLERVYASSATGQVFRLDPAP